MKWNDEQMMNKLIYETKKTFEHTQKDKDTKSLFFGDVWIYVVFENDDDDKRIIEWNKE